MCLRRSHGYNEGTIHKPCGQHFGFFTFLRLWDLKIDFDVFILSLFTLLKCSQNSVKIPPKCSQKHSKCTQNAVQKTVKMHLKCSQNSVKIHFLECLKTEILLFQLFSLYLLLLMSRWFMNVL